MHDERFLYAAALNMRLLYNTPEGFDILSLTNNKYIILPVWMITVVVKHSMINASSPILTVN